MKVNTDRLPLVAAWAVVVGMVLAAVCLWVVVLASAAAWTPPTEPARPAARVVDPGLNPPTVTVRPGRRTATQPAAPTASEWRQ